MESVAVVLVTLVRRRAIDCLREERSRTQELPTEAMSFENERDLGREEPGHEPDLEDAQMEAIRKALDELSPPEREILMLRYFHDFTEAETAETLGLARGTVRGRLMRARQALRKSLAASGL